MAGHGVRLRADAPRRRARKPPVGGGAAGAGAIEGSAGRPRREARARKLEGGQRLAVGVLAPSGKMGEGHRA